MNEPTPSPAELAHALELIEQADLLVIGAGAGMGVDSGLPDFRGKAGFWRAYPALAKSGIDFYAAANPRRFAEAPREAWGFYGHRLNLYRRTQPHAGFDILARWGARSEQGLIVYTSNVDGQFQRAGFADGAIWECHGSLMHLQCTRACSETVWPADGFEPEIDEARCELLSELPCCPRCGALARPNVLMFGDADWVDARAQRQSAAVLQRLAQARRPLVIELGAGTAVPSVRHFGHGVLSQCGGRLLRINPRESAVPFADDLGLATGALAALQAIDAALCA